MKYLTLMNVSLFFSSISLKYRSGFANKVGQCSILLFDNHQWNFCFQCLEGVQHSNCYTTANTENPQKVVRQKVNEAMSDSIKRNMDIRFVFYSNSFQFY